MIIVLARYLHKTVDAIEQMASADFSTLEEGLERIVLGIDKIFKKGETNKVPLFLCLGYAISFLNRL